MDKVSASHAALLDDGVLDELCAAAGGALSGEDAMDVEESSDQESSDEDVQQHAVATGGGAGSSSSSAVAAVAMATNRAPRRCGWCGQGGHYQRKCPSKSSGAAAAR